MEQLKIVYLSPDALTPYERNARRHGDEDVRVIENSIRENGFCDPIGIWGENNLIVEGHGRLLAAKNLGLESVPCIRLDHLTEAQRREYALTHNKSAELSGWDFAALEEELNELEAEFDMTDFGFDFDDKGPAGNEYSAEDGPADEAPESFKEYGEDMPTNHVCPKCGYRKRK
jgi:ParB-like chromosome segregation protein Spo0J/rubredoxin